MWPLLGLSIVVIGVALDRLFYFIYTYRSYRGLLKQLECAFPRADADVSGCAAACLKGRRSPLDALARIYLQYHRYPAAERNHVLQREGQRLLEKSGRFLKLLASIAHAAPLMGLLGTVTGLVAAFYTIEQLGGRVAPSDLAGGIWEALITTVAGLCVGIPALLFYQLFQSLTDRLASRMQALISELDELNYTHRKQPEIAVMTPEHEHEHARADATAAHLSQA